MAGSLRLPPEVAGVRARLAQRCERCLDYGFVACGGEAIGFGARFWPAFLRGEPPVGYLVGWTIGADALRVLLRTTPVERVRAELRRRFEAAPLVVVDAAQQVHVARRPVRVEVIVTDTLHACVFATEKPICCCCTASCKAECCEKDLGSLAVSVEWDDPQAPGRRIEYRFLPWSGTSWLAPVSASGRRPDLRFCLDGSGPGWLGEDAP